MSVRRLDRALAVIRDRSLQLERCLADDVAEPGTPLRTAMVGFVAEIRRAECDVREVVEDTARQLATS